MWCNNIKLIINTVRVFISLSVAFFVIFFGANNLQANNDSFCPPETAKTQTLIVDFFTLESSLQRRLEHGMENLNLNQLTLLTDDNHSIVCAELFEIHEQAIVAKYSQGGGKRWDVAFYAVGTFFFVIYAHKQPADSQQIAFGRSAIIIYDDELNEIAGYSF